jgi:hypothetical protein
MLIEPLETMESAATTSINVIISKKNAIVRAGGRDVLQRLLAEIDKAVDEFTDVFRSKMPLTGAPAGWLYATRAKAIIQTGINAYRY